MNLILFYIYFAYKKQLSVKTITYKMTSIATNNPPIRLTKCSVCDQIGHNIRSCAKTPFRMAQAHQTYLSMWLSWFQQINTQLVDVTDYFRYARIVSRQKYSWIRNPMNFRLLKSYLKVTHLKYKHATCNYIDGLYHYLVLKKNGVLDYVIQNNSPRLAELAALATTNYAHYDYLLETIPQINLINIFNTRQYGIVVEKKEIEDTIQEKSCDICYEDYPCDNFVKTNCDHSFCQSCVTNTIQILPTNKKLSCAMCRSTVTHLSCYTSQNNTNLKNVLNLSTF